MENFDLRKYLAEGKLRVNEGDMDHLMQDLEGELKRHDWFYYMADDNRSYVKGEDQQREIKRLLKMLNNSPEAIALYNKYAPVQDGIDLRIKEEKIEEAVELPKDIKWEFDDVIDQMDAYNATISLIGHSESTGKDYTASAEASKSGGGDDWDWMEVDEVEEETVAEEKRPDYPDVDKDGDTEESMEKALKDKKENLKEWGSSDWHYFLDAMHTDLGKPTDAPDIFKVLDVAGDAVDKYWDDWEEYETDYEGLKMDAAQTYLKTKFPEYFKGMQALFAPMNETIDEEYNVGKGMEKDHDFDAMLDHALKLHAGTSIEDLKKVAHDFTDVNYHREVAYLEDAIDMLEAGKHEEFEDSLKLFKDEVKKTIRSFKESIEESLRAWNVIDIDGNVTHEGLSYEEALAIAKEVEGHKIRPTNMMLDEDYDPDQEQLDDEDEIFMPMDDEGRPLEEALNPEVSKAVDRLIKALAKKYDYSERDAVFAIQAALKQRGFDNVNEGYYGSSDIDNIVSTIGYDDIDSFFNDNPGAVDAIIQWAETVPDFERMLQDAGMIEEDEDMMQEGISKALSDAIDSWTDDEKVRKAAKAFAAYKLHKKGPDPLKDLDDETYHKALDAYRDAKNIDEDLDLGHQDDEPGMLKSDIYSIGKAAMELYQMVDEFDGEGEVDFPHWWQSKVIKAKDALQGAKHYLEFEMNEPAVDAMVTKDNLEEIGMFNDPIGYEKSQPETSVFTKKYAGKDAYHILKNGKKFRTLSGSEGEANAYINKRNRELKEEDSFFTKDVKDAVISKLMDQLKK